MAGISDEQKGWVLRSGGKASDDAQEIQPDTARAPSRLASGRVPNIISRRCLSPEETILHADLEQPGLQFSSYDRHARALLAIRMVYEYENLVKAGKISNSLSAVSALGEKEARALLNTISTWIFGHDPDFRAAEIAYQKKYPCKPDPDVTTALQESWIGRAGIRVIKAVDLVGTVIADKIDKIIPSPAPRTPATQALLDMCVNSLILDADRTHWVKTNLFNKIYGSNPTEEQRSGIDRIVKILGRLAVMKKEILNLDRKSVSVDIDYSPADIVTAGTDGVFVDTKEWKSIGEHGRYGAVFEKISPDFAKRALEKAHQNCERAVGQQR
jgi:hypothetical protein